MPPRSEIEGSLYGAWRLVLRDPDSLSYFNITADGFWRSFFAAAIVAPLFLISSLLSMDLVADDAAAPAPTIGFVALTFNFVIAWIAYVVLMFPVTRLLNLEARYAAYIIVWNWTAVLQVGLLLVAALMRGSGLFSAGVGDVALIAAVLTSLYIAYLVARAALGCDIPIAVGLVIFENVLHLAVDRTGHALFG